MRLAQYHLAPGGRKRAEPFLLLFTAPTRLIGACSLRSFSELLEILVGISDHSAARLRYTSTRQHLMQQKPEDSDCPCLRVFPTDSY